jgi:hypothetical protein
VNGFDESGAGDGVEGGLGCLSAGWFDVGVQESGEGLAEQRPGAMPERHEGVECWELTGFDQGWREQVGRGAGMEVEEMDADGDTETLLAIELEGPVGQVGKGKVCGGVVGFGEPAFSRRGGGFCHGK